MDYSDEENNSDGESIDDMLGPEDLFNDEADEEIPAEDDFSNAEKTETQVEDTREKKQKQIRQPRIVKNPRVTLNIDALSGKNGLSALKKLFSNFKFKGNGHEKEDLIKILGILKQWMCYQLCPSYNFESCMLQLEALGKKRAVQTLMKKYRLGIHDWGESKSQDSDISETDKAMEVNDGISTTDDFDLLQNADIPDAENDIELSQDDVGRRQNTQPENDITLTPEQLERIARNRKLAEDRRQKLRSTHGEQTVINELPERNGTEDVSMEKINED